MTEHAREIIAFTLYEDEWHTAIATTNPKAVRWEHLSNALRARWYAMAERILRRLSEAKEI